MKPPKRSLLPALALALSACLAGCGKSSDTPAAEAGGGASIHRNVITLKGEAQ